MEISDYLKKNQSTRRQFLNRRTIGRYLSPHRKRAPTPPKGSSFYTAQPSPIGRFKPQGHDLYVFEVPYNFTQKLNKQGMEGSGNKREGRGEKTRTEHGRTRSLLRERKKSFSPYSKQSQIFQ